MSGTDRQFALHQAVTYCTAASAAAGFPPDPQHPAVLVTLVADVFYEWLTAPGSVAGIQQSLNQLNTKADQIMAVQDDVNAAVAAISAVVTDLTAAAANIQAEIATLVAEIGTPVDTTALNAAVEALGPVQAAVDALESAPPSV